MQTTSSPTRYTGDVVSGGASDVRELPGLVIRKASVGPMDNNAYLLTCTKTGARLLIDAANDAGRLVKLLSEDGAGGELEMIVTTHRHYDHHGALAQLVSHTGARTAAGSEDAEALPVAVDVALVDGDVLSFGD